MGITHANEGFKESQEPFDECIIKEPRSRCKQVTSVYVKNNSSSWIYQVVSFPTKILFCKLDIMWNFWTNWPVVLCMILFFLHSHWHMTYNKCVNLWDIQKIIHTQSINSQHYMMNIVNESVCAVGVVLLVWWEQRGSLCPSTCAELRAFHLFPSLAPDLPPTMGSWPRRLTPARTPRHSGCRHVWMRKRALCTYTHAYCFLCVRSDLFLPAYVILWPLSNTLISCKFMYSKLG